MSVVQGALEVAKRGEYGTASGEVARLLSLVKTVSWFRSGQPGPDLEQLARAQTARLAERIAGARNLEAFDLQLRISSGGFALLSSLLPPIETMFAPHTDWGLGDLHVRLHSRIQEDPELARLLGPPIWPKPGQVSYVSALYPEDDLFSSGIVPASDDAVLAVRRILAQAGDDTIDAILWVLVGEPAHLNPYEPLLVCYSSGLVPVQVHGHDFAMFHFVSSPA